MPDYSKSIIYRIYCKDENIIGEYIGSTVNKYDRKKVINHIAIMKIHRIIIINYIYSSEQMVDLIISYLRR